MVAWNCKCLCKGVIADAMKSEAEKRLFEQATQGAIALGERVGIALNVAKFVPLLMRSAEHRAAVVLRLHRKGAEDLIYKQVFAPFDTAAFQQGVEAHKRALERLIKAKGVGVPKILAVDNVTQSVLMQRVSGKTLNDHMLQSYANPRKRHELLTRSAAWLAAFHQPDSVKKSTFYPGFMMDHLQAQIDKIENGDKSVPHADRLKAAHKILLDRIDQFHGGETVTVAAHGDMHTRNLLISPDMVSGIDFNFTHNAPIGHDISRLLIDYATRFAQDQSLESENIIPANDMDAFFAGYGAQYRNDASVRFLLHQQILLEWLSIPAKEDSRSYFQSHRLDGVLRLTNHVFGV